MALTRVARTARAPLEHTFYDLDGEAPADADGAVTVTVTDANGLAVTSGPATSAGPGTYRFTLPGQALVGELTARWSGTFDGTAVVEDDLVEVCGRHLFSLAEARASDSSLSSVTKYPTSELRRARLVVEVELEEIADRAFTRRYRRVVLDGTGSAEVILDDTEVRSIRAARVATRADGTFTALTTGELAALVTAPDKVLRRVDGQVWPEGRGNVIVEYEHGWDAPPVDLVEAALVRLRSVLHQSRTNVPDRAKSFTTTDGTTYRVTLPDAYRTGIPYVDGIYSRYSLRADTGAENTSGGGGGDMPVPASRTIHFDPQRDSIFHGGRR